jgi:hypothetical protein
MAAIGQNACPSDDEIALGGVLAAEPPARLVWHWRDPSDGCAFLINWQLEEVGGGCLLRFEQRVATGSALRALAGNGLGNAGNTSSIFGDFTATTDVDSDHADAGVWAQRIVAMGQTLHDLASAA